MQTLLSQRAKKWTGALALFAMVLIMSGLHLSCDDDSRQSKKKTRLEIKTSEAKREAKGLKEKAGLDKKSGSIPGEELNDIKINSIYNETARFLAAMPLDKSSQFYAKTQTKSYIKYKRTMDWLWKTHQKPNLDKIVAWRKKTLQIKSNDTVLYPFSGPDILNALAFYPDAKEYIMFGLEKPGEMPNLQKSNLRTMNYGLLMLNKALHYLVIRNYFITMSMQQDMKVNSFSSFTGVMMFLLARYNYEVLEVKKISIDRHAKVVQGHIRSRYMIAGIEISFRKDSGSPVQKLRYFSQNVEHKFINRYPHFIRYLSAKNNYSTIIKAASFLMHIHAFKKVRDLVLSRSEHIIQDSSGIPMRYFSAKHWHIT
ncbi:MAG: hypothetical protein OEZ36_12425, partial [Spirochaetota bacterium]|nr:hypothetical protein [Spirochaetota bacterium]